MMGEQWLGGGICPNAVLIQFVAAAEERFVTKLLTNSTHTFFAAHRSSDVKSSDLGGKAMTLMMITMSESKKGKAFFGFFFLCSSSDFSMLGENQINI